MLRRILPSFIPVKVLGSTNTRLEDKGVQQFLATARLLLNNEDADACLAAIPVEKTNAMLRVLSIAQMITKTSVNTPMQQGKDLLSSIEKASRGIVGVVEENGIQVRKRVSSSVLQKWTAHIRRLSRFISEPEVENSISEDDRIRVLVSKIINLCAVGAVEENKINDCTKDSISMSEKQRRKAAEFSGISSIFEEWIKVQDYDTHYNTHKNLRAVLNAFMSYLHDKKCEVLSPRNDSKGANNSVWFGTVHQAKGLQWKAVFVIQANDDVFPLFGDQTQGRSMFPYLSDTEEGFSNSTEDAPRGQLVEERNILYVAMSRAEKYLRISYLAERPNQKGISRFLNSVINHKAARHRRW
eukprot:CAMPEP_0182422474 /NCGR_PEP_ID=MMETSP1167-20130531/8195_1 /TAXON_ID=2988 /ORGANISM="Mallomonas Sp, Strain CCMP3275" /LENGTH=354 /DNA_ID=CAMNT_0024600591 /DNA_START=390 /DNA_END=1451 /DNA_ORIENTATION=+